MPSFRSKYPYTDNNELNLDWIIAAIKELKIKVPNPPTQVGQYVLQATVTSDGVTFQWVQNN